MLCYYCKKAAVSKDNLDYQARWKSKRMQDNYVGMELSWPDITCASKLCKGGFIIYKPKEGLGLTDDWLSRFIAPATTAAFDEGVGAILGRALLWACMDPNAAESVSPDIRQAVTSEFIKLETTLEDGENPIERLEVVCSESQGIVNLDVIPSAEQADFEAANGGGVLGVGAAIQMQQLCNGDM